MNLFCGDLSSWAYYILIDSELPLTARQYGEVVLPDAASDREIVPVGQKAVTVQGGYGAFFASQGTNFAEHYECRGTRLIGSR